MNRETYKNLPRILVPTISSWSGTEHALTNIFKCYNPDKIAQIFTREKLPDTFICNKFFRISENLVLKSVFNRFIKTGEEVKNTPEKYTNASLKKENDRYNYAHKKHSWFLTLMREAVWFLGKWKTKELNDFVTQFNPQLLFINIYPNVYMCKIQNYLIKKYNLPVVSYVTDDIYTYEVCHKNVLQYFHRFLLRKQVKKLMLKTDKLFVISEKQKAEYDKIFGFNSVILTKGINYTDISFEPYKAHKPINFVYTGKMLIGRNKTLSYLADVLNDVNENIYPVTFNIYSQQADFSDGTMKKINNGCARHNGAVSPEDSVKVQQTADVLVFAESLEPDNAQTARLSFSEKLTDYFKSGKCIFAIGKKDLAPIEYLAKNNAALIANSYEEIAAVVKEIIEKKDSLYLYGEKSFNLGLKNHSNKIMDERLINTILAAYNKEK